MLSLGVGSGYLPILNIQNLIFCIEDAFILILTTNTSETEENLTFNVIRIFIDSNGVSVIKNTHTYW